VAEGEKYIEEANRIRVKVPSVEEMEASEFNNPILM